ncbi:MAG: SDR family oxidoreductase [Planctomycetota bacterium]
MSRVLVTGGAGFIGSHLATRLVELGHIVRVVDDFSTGKRNNLAHLQGRFELVEDDLRNPAVCAKVCKEVEFVFHQAAIPSVPKSVDNPLDSHEANINATFHLLRGAVEQKVRRFIYAASSSAYGDAAESAKHEGIIPAPLSPYAVQKLTGEHYARAFFECYGLQTISLRYFNVFGPWQDPNSTYAAAIPAFVTAILQGDPPLVYGDGTQTRDFTYIDNVVDGNVLAMQAQKTIGESVNVACGGAISVNEVIAEINRALNTNVATRFLPPRAGDVKHSRADIRLAQSLLHYSPKIDFATGLQRTIDYYRSLTSSTAGRSCLARR